MPNNSAEIQRYQKMLQDEKKNVKNAIGKIALLTYSKTFEFSPFPEGKYSTGHFKGNNIFSVNGAVFTEYEGVRDPQAAFGEAQNIVNAADEIKSFHITNSSTGDEGDYTHFVEFTGWKLTPPYMPYTKSKAWIPLFEKSIQKDFQQVRK